MSTGGRIGNRAPSTIPREHRARLMEHFSKADLAELAWDYCRQLDGEGSTLDAVIYQQLLDRRSLLTGRR